ncbi:TlpA family protein disulfide reductase [Chryseobacterium sp. A301]
MISIKTCSKQILLLSFVLVFSLGYAQRAPESPKTSFSKEALAESLTAKSGTKTSVGAVLEKYKGKVLVIDFWASWCKDCILALPKTQEIKQKYPQVDFVYFSLDRSYEQWNRGLAKYNMESWDHYWFDQGWKNPFNVYIELNWVPRFMVVDQTSDIALYYAISPEDPNFLEVLERLSVANGN